MERSRKQRIRTTERHEQLCKLALQHKDGDRSMSRRDEEEALIWLRLRPAWPNITTTLSANHELVPRSKERAAIYRAQLVVIGRVWEEAGSQPKFW